MSSVCDNQADFNKAFREAVKNDMKKNKPWIYVSTVLLLIFLIWAVLLAMQVPKGSERVEHLLFAMLFSPVYVLAYYLGILGKNSAQFGMCGCSSK